MNLREAMLGLGQAYRKMNAEAKRLASIVHERGVSEDHAIKIQAIIESNFYYKHDLPAVLRLTQQYNIPNEQLQRLVNNYKELEAKITDALQPECDTLSLQGLSVGPKSIQAYGDVVLNIVIGEHEVLILVWPATQKDSTISPPDEQFEQRALLLKTRLTSFLHNRQIA